MSEPLSPNTDRPLPPELRGWLDGQPEPERTELEQAWRLAGLAEPVPPTAAESDAAWQRVVAALDAEEPATPRRRHAVDRAPVRRSRTRWAYAALPVLAVVLAGIAFLYWLRPVTVTAPAGEIVSVELPDGSTVRLGSLSSIGYRRGVFASGRNVSLRGEAFFDVVKGEEPFTVETLNATVTVLGTRFGVRALPVEGVAVTSVVLESGAVRLASKGEATDPVVLAPGQRSTVTGLDAPTTPVSVDVAAALAWLEGGFAFFDQPVGAVLDEIERRFGVEIAAPEATRRETLSIYLPTTPNAETALADLCAYLGCTYRQTQAGFTIQNEQ